LYRKHKEEGKQRTMLFKLSVTGTQEAILLAHDWGGTTAWMLAMKTQSGQEAYSSQSASFCVFSSRAVSPSQFLWSWYVMFFQIPWLPKTLYRIGGAHGIAQVFRRTSSNPALLEEVIPGFRSNALRPGGLTAMWNWYLALIRGNGWRQLSDNTYRKVAIPTLLIWGSDDIALSLRTTEGTEA
jgi:pimeloyl-ACP methyl ester carboxylesterase